LKVGDYVSVNYENVLYPEEAIKEYQSNLLDVYAEDYGEEHLDMIKERIENTLYLFDINPVDTVVELYDHAKGDASLTERMTREAVDFSKLQDKALRKFRKPYIELLSRTFNVRRGAKKLLELDFSFILDSNISEEEYLICDEIYQRKCKRLGITPIYDFATVSALISTEEMLTNSCDLFVFENSLWGKRITNKVREKFGNLSIFDILETIKSANLPSLATSTQILSKDENAGSILYFPLVCLLDIGDIDHTFFHEHRHVIETGSNGCGLKTKHGGVYSLINEVHTEVDSLHDLAKLSGKVLWGQDKSTLRNAYQDLFPYVLDFFIGNRDLLNTLALYNNTELLEEIFGTDSLLKLEFFMEELYEKVMQGTEFYSSEKITEGKKLIKTLDENAYSYFRKID